MIHLDPVVDGRPVSLLLDTCANNTILSARAEGLDEFTRLVRDGVPVSDSSDANVTEFETRGVGGDALHSESRPNVLHSLGILLRIINLTSRKG